MEDNCFLNMDARYRCELDRTKIIQNTFLVGTTFMEIFYEQTKLEDQNSSRTLAICQLLP